MDSPDAVAAAPCGHQVSVIQRQPRQNFPLRYPGGDTVQELINSFVRLSAAMTVYSMQQMQSAVDTIDPKVSYSKLKKMIDSMTDALTAQLDESKMKTVESISNLGSDVVDRTFETLNVEGLNAHDLVQSTNNMVRKTTDSLASIIKSDKTDDKKASSAKHKSKEEAVASH
jgi:hypothetical protein